MTRSRALAFAGAVLTASLALTGCGEYNQNADKGPDRNTAPADIINMPEGFRNVAHKCDGPNMVYVTSRGTTSDLPSTVFVVANDPRCAGR